ncbi:MAG: alkaline phosphatase family protein [Brevibacillus sp.]|nr:alkaline phosphatase family protein [Brevibacillus sp.]
MFRKSLIVTAVCLLLLALIFGCSRLAGEGADENASILAKRNSAGKKVIVLLIDSLLTEALEQLRSTNQVPALSFFIANGSYRRDVISSFPTMSVTIDSSLLTGSYADRHGIPGLVWYHEGERRIVNYGDGMRVAWDPGLRRWLGDVLYEMNHAHLSTQVKTLYEELHERGFTSGSINGLIYRGPAGKQLQLPIYLRFAMGGQASLKVKGPDVLVLGALAAAAPERLPTSTVSALGINDEYSIDSLIHLIQTNSLPDLTLVFLPDMDGELHRHGPTHLSSLVKVDRQLQRLLDSFGDWERALKEHIFVVMGDSGVVPTGRDKQSVLIDLEKRLADYQRAESGRQVQPSDEVAIAINGRMCYIYALSPRVPLEALAAKLKDDPRIDLLAWKENEWIHVMRGGGSGERLRYRPGREDAKVYKQGAAAPRRREVGPGLHVTNGYRLWEDEYGQHWEIHGDWRVMDLRTRTPSGKIASDLYPDGLRRLASVFSSHRGRFLAATAVPGTEFAGGGTPNHPGGGNHGSLHRLDTLIPLIVSGAPPLPEPPRRVVDLKAYLLSLVKQAAD